MRVAGGGKMQVFYCEVGKELYLLQMRERRV